MSACIVENGPQCTSDSSTQTDSPATQLGELGKLPCQPPGQPAAAAATVKFTAEQLQKFIKIDSRFFGAKAIRHMSARVSQWPAENKPVVQLTIM